MSVTACPDFRCMVYVTDSFVPKLAVYDILSCIQWTKRSKDQYLLLDYFSWKDLVVLFCIPSYPDKLYPGPAFVFSFFKEHLLSKNNNFDFKLSIGGNCKGLFFSTERIIFVSNLRIYLEKQGKFKLPIVNPS